MSDVIKNDGVVETTVFGIDLGTTYSCISYLKDGHSVLCQSIEGENTTPSVVRITDPDNLSIESGWVAGRTAKETAIIYPNDTFQFIKSKIGRVDTVDYGDEDNRRSISPVEVSSYILRKLKNDAETATGMTVEHVVITCPAYFTAAEKDATKKAGEMAGLNVWNIIEEPTAAAVYYGMEHYDEKETICVFDLGGGTFDVTAMTIDNGRLKVETTEGNHDLGGKNWDAVLVEYVKEKFIEETGYSEEFDDDTEQELLIKCETAKIQLTGAESANIALKIDRKHAANIEITRETFDDLTSSLLQSAIDLTRKVFDIMQERKNPITKLLLVGGSSYMPQVKKAVVDAFGLEPFMNEPNASVSKGACLYCAMFPNPTPVPNPDDENSDAEAPCSIDIDEGIVTITGSTGETHKVNIQLPGTKRITVIPCASKSFGIKVLVNDKPMVANLVKKDQELPYSVTQEFGIAFDDMRDVSITVYQSDERGDIADISSCVVIGEGVLEGLPAGMPANTPVKITFDIDQSGMIGVRGAYQDQELTGTVAFAYEEGVYQKNM